MPGGLVSRFAALLLGLTLTLAAAPVDPRDDASPWGISVSAETSGEFPRFNPLLKQAGVRWLRLFPAWPSLERQPGKWDWSKADAIVADTRRNGLHLSGMFVFFPPWASADGKNPRACPVKDQKFWREYVTQVVTRYKQDIKYWEVWNEFNGGGFAISSNKPKDYADMTRETFDAAKAADPTCKIGMSCANFDVGFFDGAIKAGAADHFDFICVHPYEQLDCAVEGDVNETLSMAASLRKMLADNYQKADMPLWISEMGYYAPVQPDPAQDALQAEALVKGFTIALAQGFERIEWFEIRGVVYDKKRNRDLSLVRRDWSPRPAYDALKLMTRLMGPEPKYLGWLKAGDNGYGFVFQGRGTKFLVAWGLPKGADKVTFAAPVRVIDPAGKETRLPAGTQLTLTASPVFIADLPETLAAQAAAQAAQPFPWGADYSAAQEVSCRLGARNLEKGLKQLKPEGTKVVNYLEESCRQLDLSKPAGAYTMYRVAPTFAPFGTTNLEITVVARLLSAEKPSGMTLMYESLFGYKGVKNGWWNIPAGDGWHEHTWKVHDASFVGAWGYNFRTDSIGAKNEFLIREVRVKKTAGR